MACLKLTPSWRASSVHGSWREFDIDESTITVRSGIARTGQDQHQVLTLADIQHAAISLDDIEAELGKLQSAVEARR